MAVPNRALLPLINLELRADDVEDILVSSLNFLDLGTANAVTGVVPNSVRLFQNTSAPTVASEALAQGNFASDNGLVTLAHGPSPGRAAQRKHQNLGDTG